MKHTILFVDDESHVVESLRVAMRKEPYDIVTATSAAEALELLGQREVDVVVSDERMPGMSGTEFLAEVRRKYPRTVRIILTGQASLEAAIRAINEGEVYRFLSKPCHPADLSVTIRQALQLRCLAQESSRLLAKSRKQRAVLRDLERTYPGIGRVTTDESGAIVVEEESVEVDELIRAIEREIEPSGSSGAGNP
jgi:two-component system probable response regulator PhcQ